MSSNPTGHPGPEDDVPETGLTEVPITLPHDYDLIVGDFGRERHVAIWYLPGAGAMVSDGWSSFEADWRAFQRWDNEAGVEMLKRAADVSEDHDREDVPDIAPSLTHIMAESGYNIGSDDWPGNAAFLYDAAEDRLLVGARDEVKETVRRLNPEPEDFPKGTVDWESIKTAIEHMDPGDWDIHIDRGEGDDSE